MTYNKKTHWITSLGLAAALLGPVAYASYASAEEVVVVHERPGHRERERARERRADEREAERDREREHERRVEEHERHERHERHEVFIRP
jgi:hypothetical protein